jgi:hypothetical protein
MKRSLCLPLYSLNLNLITRWLLKAQGILGKAAAIPDGSMPS